MSKPSSCHKPARAALRRLSCRHSQLRWPAFANPFISRHARALRYFSQLTGNSVHLKLDNLQRTGAFKERGALNKLLTLTKKSATAE